MLDRTLRAEKAQDGHRVAVEILPLYLTEEGYCGRAELIVDGVRHRAMDICLSEVGLAFEQSDTDDRPGVCVWAWYWVVDLLCSLEQPALIAYGFKEA